MMSTVPEEMGYPSYTTFLGAKSSSHKCGQGIAQFATELLSCGLLPTTTFEVSWEQQNIQFPWSDLR